MSGSTRSINLKVYIIYKSIIYIYILYSNIQYIKTSVAKGVEPSSSDLRKSQQTAMLVRSFCSFCRSRTSAEPLQTSPWIDWPWGDSGSKFGPVFMEKMCIPQTPSHSLAT